MGELKRLGPGWLAKSIAAANEWYAENKEWADAVRANWIDDERQDAALSSHEEGGAEHG